MHRGLGQKFCPWWENLTDSASSKAEGRREQQDLPIRVAARISTACGRLRLVLSQYSFLLMLLK